MSLCKIDRQSFQIILKSLQLVQIILRNPIFLIIIDHLTQQTMTKKLIRFNLQQKQAIKELFLKDPQTDFIVILQRKIFPLHKKVLQCSQYFNQFIVTNKKTVSIQEHFNPDFFQNILGCFYGIQATFQRHYIVDHILKILQLLRVKQLSQQLKQDMQINFEQYGLFNLFYLSEIFDMKDIQDRCLKQLIDQEFQQINYNKYDLFQLSPELFIYILKQHQRLKAKRTIAGLDSSLVRAVCQQYCKTNSVKINVDQIFRYGKQCLEQQVSDFQQKQTIIPRKRNSTWHNTQTLRLSMEPRRKISQTVDLSCSSQVNKRDYFQEKQNEVQKIKQLNEKMQQKNYKIMAEINLAKSTIIENSQQNAYGMDELQKKLKQFEQKSNIAHKKLQELKNKMLKINEQYSDDQENQRELQQLRYLKNNLQNYSKVLSGIGMVVLDKQQNIGSESSDF